MEIKKTKGTILIDDEDAGVLDGCQVSFKGSSGYVRLRWNNKLLRPKERNMARVIMGLPVGGDAVHALFVDHINHNTLDNRRCNLRVCTKSENARNNAGQRTRKTSNYKGVTYHDCKKYKVNATGLKPWRAYTRMAGKRIWFGYYATEEDAALAYNENAKRLFGEFAYLNDVPGIGKGTTKTKLFRYP